MYRTFAEMQKSAPPVKGEAVEPVAAASPTTHNEFKEEELSPPSSKVIDHEGEKVSIKSMWDDKEVLSMDDSDASATDVDELEEDAVVVEEEEEETTTVEDEVEEDLVYIPPPRNTATIKFKHTPRVFKTPMRESKRGKVNIFLVDVLCE